MSKYISILFSLLLTTSVAWATSPKRELRASWVTTVWAIDWPNARGNTTQITASQKASLISILDKLKASNMNAAFFQVRGFADAMYQSSYEPWSQYLTGERGKAPQYDPLAFAIEEAHKRGIELHAWINPYRYSTSADNHGELITDYAKANPTWLMTADQYTKILNPGMPEVIERIVNIVKEIVANYNVDGVVFDDYFYINGGTTDAMDQIQYEQYNPNNLSRADWRRQNVNNMVKSVYEAIQSTKPYVTFGISPAGVAASNAAVANKYGVPVAPVGSDWQYNGIYSDPLAWLNAGTIDYISPQLYWTIGSSNDYARLCTWWSDVANKFGKHFYASHSLSALTGVKSTAINTTVQIGNQAVPINGLSGVEQNIIASIETQATLPQIRSTKFTAPEIANQIACNRASDKNDAPGSVFYATNKLVNTLGFTDFLKETVFQHPAIIPAISWKYAPTQPLVLNMTHEGGHLLWNTSDPNVRFTVYSLPSDQIGETGVFNNAIHLLGTTYQNVMNVGALPQGYTYAVSVLDRYGNEFPAAILGGSQTANTAPTLIYPTHQSQVLLPCIFKWSAISGANSYIWQIAEDEQFNKLIATRQTTEPTFFSGVLATLEEHKTYYWRVASRVTNAVDAYSPIYSFSGTKFGFIYPANGAQEVELTPTFTWDRANTEALYTLEISTDPKFSIPKQVYLKETTTTALTIPETILIGGTTYYARITAAYDGLSVISETTLFYTKELDTPIPVIVTPINQQQIFGDAIAISWKKQNAKGFRVELSTSILFPPRNTTVKITDAHSYATTYERLAPNTYYIRVKALLSDSYTEPSEVTQVLLTTETSLSETNTKGFNCSIFTDEYKNQLLQIESQHSATATITLYSLTGAQLWQQKSVVQAGDTHVPLDTKELSKGLYMVKVEMNGIRRVVKLLLK